MITTIQGCNEIDLLLSQGYYISDPEYQAFGVITHEI